MNRPPYADDELFSRCRRGSFVEVEPGWEGHLRAARDRHGASLLHVAAKAETVRALLAAGLDPNARDRRGRTPLMGPKDAEANRLLLAAGADLHAVDEKAQTVLCHQANPPDGATVGYSTPDFAALDVLVAAGATRPTPAEAAQWLKWAESLVSAAIEAGDYAAFRKWLERLLASPSGPASASDAAPASPSGPASA
ncbi:MAG TPA: hypothetical protein VFS00_26775, partial [Polyangiaceae bacterium]|nr:hypothetical protein [Polyangiaceae bacterium]